MMNTNKEIRKYCNYHGYSDVYPYEVVRVISDQTVEVREMDARLKEGWKQDVVLGGFAGHTINNGGEWDIESNEDNPLIRARWSKARGQWQVKKADWDAPMRMNMSDQPRKFRDYNF